MEKSRLCLLGFSGSILSLVFNTLKSSGFTGTLLVVENMKVDDPVTFECELPYQRIWHEDFRPLPGDTYSFSLMRPSFKETVFNQFKQQHGLSSGQFVNILHPTAILARNCSLATGIYAEPGCIISPYAEIGFGVSLNRGCTIGHHTAIEDFATINPGVHIAGHCRIGRATSIGIGTTMLDHTSVGRGTTIGGGSVVTKNIPDHVMAFGNPCKIIKTIEPK